MSNIEQEIKEYKEEHSKLTSKLDKLKNEKAVAAAEYKQVLKDIIGLYPELEGSKPKEIIEFLEREYNNAKEEIEKIREESEDKGDE